MNRVKGTLAVVFFISALSTTGPAYTSYAESGYGTSPGDKSCAISQSDFDKLESIKNDYSVGYSEEIKLELQLRKKILGNIVNCAVWEASNLKNNIDGIKLGDQDSMNLRSQLSNQLDNAINYYKTQQAQIGDLGLQGSKNFAKNLGLWREGNYKTPAKMATNFLIWGGNQGIMQTAQARVDQIGRSVTLLSLVYNEEIKGQWNEVGVNFSEAKRLNEQAKSDLKFATPDDALTTIKSSLDSLSKTYEKLSELVGAINKALALPG